MMMHRSFLLVATIVVGLLVMMGESIQPNEYARYTTVTGFFEQDDPKTVSGSFDYVRSRLTLIDMSLIQSR